MLCTLEYVDITSAELLGSFVFQILESAKICTSWMDNQVCFLGARQWSMHNVP